VAHRKPVHHLVYDLRPLRLHAAPLELLFTFERSWKDRYLISLLVGGGLVLMSSLSHGGNSGAVNPQILLCPEKKDLNIQKKSKNLAPKMSFVSQTLKPGYRPG